MSVRHRPQMYSSADSCCVFLFVGLRPETYSTAPSPSFRVAPSIAPIASACPPSPPTAPSRPSLNFATVVQPAQPLPPRASWTIPSGPSLGHLRTPCTAPLNPLWTSSRSSPYQAQGEATTCKSQIFNDAPAAVEIGYRTAPEKKGQGNVCPAAVELEVISPNPKPSLDSTAQSSSERAPPSSPSRLYDSNSSQLYSNVSSKAPDTRDECKVPKLLDGVGQRERARGGAGEGAKGGGGRGEGASGGGGPTGEVQTADQAESSKVRFLKFFTNSVSVYFKFRVSNSYSFISKSDNFVLFFRVA
jgi:hypothetical protein